MIGYIALFTALSIAGVAAWFSIAGLIAIFSASALPIAIMGSVLEVGKLTTASWLYRNWKDTKLALKSYLLMSVVVLMFITSMGIFGFLSKAHLDQTAPISSNHLKIERINTDLEYHKNRISENRQSLTQLDSVINTLVEYDKISGPDGAKEVRKDQAPQRNMLNSSIKESREKISKLEDKKLELRSQIQEIKNEVGPIKYIADIIYENPEDNIDKSVQIVILIIVLVFDPLAVLLLVAANKSLIQKKKEKETHNETNIEKDSATTAQNQKTDPLLGRSNVDTDTSRTDRDNILPEGNTKNQKSKKVDTDKSSAASIKHDKGGKDE